MIFHFFEVYAEELSLVPRLLLKEGDISSFPVRPSKFTLWQIYKPARVYCDLCFAIAIFTTCLSIEAHIVVLFQ